MEQTHFIKPCPVCSQKDVEYERTLNNIELIRCFNCNFVYANTEDVSVKDKNFEYDDRATERYNRQQTFIDTLWFKKIAQRMTKIAQKGTVLDIGCGNGMLLRNFIDLGWQAHGLDMADWATEYAEKYNYKLYSSELEKADLPNDYFDVITSTSTLEHIPKPYEHVKEIIRILKPGGIAYWAGIPNYGSLSIKLNLSTFKSNIPPEHVNFFSAKSMKTLFEKPGIKNNTQKISISTYGIPELQRIYHPIKNTFRKIIKNKPKSTHSSENAPAKKEYSLTQTLLAETTIAGYYYLGKPFNLGNKLEIIAVKK